MTGDGLIRVVPAAPLPFAAGRPQNRERTCMQGLIVIGILVCVGYSLYRSGKRIGSRKGYNAGRSRGRRRR